MISVRTRSTGTLHTSAKARLTSIAIRIRIRDPDRHQNLNVCSLAHCQPSLKISSKSVRKFLLKAANSETDRQTTTITYLLGGGKYVVIQVYPTLGIEYGKPLPFTYHIILRRALAHGEEEGGDPDADEDVVVENAAEEVSLAVHLARVELVEQSHRDQRREHHRIVHVRLRNVGVLRGVVDVEQRRPFIHVINKPGIERVQACTR